MCWQRRWTDMKSDIHGLGISVCRGILMSRIVSNHFVVCVCFIKLWLN